MRADFDKVLTERPRAGGGKWGTEHRIKEKKLDDDFSVKHEPMSMGRGSKQFTDLIGPLYRWMEKQVGRPWDKVYSELKETFGARNVQHQHLLSHVGWMVEFNCFKRDHKIYNSMGLEVNVYGSRRPQFYVMDDGILKMVKKSRRKFTYSNVDPTIKKIGDKTYKTEDGIWYEVEFNPNPEVYFFGGRARTIGLYKSKKQLSKKELRQLGLNNAIDS